MALRLYGCGENSDGYLDEPRSCLRRSVGEEHCCEHNNQGRDCSYCRLWPLKLKPVTRPSQNVRIIGSDDGSTFVQVDDHLRHLSYLPLDDDELALVTDAIHPSRIEQAIVLSGSHRAAFLCDNGELFVLFTQDGNNQPSSRLRSIPGGRHISHIAVRSACMRNPALISGAVAVVLESDPRTVVSFDSWQPMIAWLTDNETKQGPAHSVTFAIPIVKLTGKFAALDEACTVHVWGDKGTDSTPDPPDEDEQLEEAWNRCEFFGDPIQRWPSRLPEALNYTPRSLPLPPIKKLATGGCYNVGVSHAGQLFIWVYRSDKWPEIADVNPMSASEFKEAVINTDTGNRLQIVDAAAGRAHVVALATDGSLWSAGDGLNGQLSIGTKQFGLCTGDGLLTLRPITLVSNLPWIGKGWIPWGYWVMERHARLFFARATYIDCS